MKQKKFNEPPFINGIKTKEKILILVVVLTFIFGIWGFMEAGKEMVDSFFRTLASFTFETPDVEPNWQIYVTRLLANGFILWGTYTIIQYNIKHIYRLRKYQKKPYTLVSGLGENNRHFLSSVGADSKTIIVEQDKENDYIDEYRNKGFAVMIDDCLDRDYFLRIKIENLDNMIISTGDDRKNIEVANNFLQTYSKESKELNKDTSKKLFIHIEDKKIKSLFHKEIVKPVKNVEIIPYSYFEQSVKLLFSKHTVLGDMTEIIHTEEALNMIVVGDGKLAMELVYQICLLTHLPNENHLNLYCIAKDATTFVEKVYEEFRYIEKIPNITVKALNLDYIKRDFFEDPVFNETNLTNIYLSYDESDINLDIVIDLADMVYLKASVDRTLKTKIFFAIYDQMILSQTISNNCDKFKQFYTFGNAAEVLSKENIINQVFDTTAKLIHQSYGDEYDPNILITNEKTWKEIESKWNNTTTMHEKGSNKAQALHIDIKLAALGLKKVKSDKDKKTLLQTNKQIFEPFQKENAIPDSLIKTWSQELNKCYGGEPFDCSFFPETFDSLFDKIIRSEHNRWNAYHYLLGWNYGEDDERAIKEHRCLIPFSKFKNPKSKITILYDMYSLLYLPNYLANTGFEIKRCIQK